METNTPMIAVPKAWIEGLIEASRKVQSDSDVGYEYLWGYID